MFALIRLKKLFPGKIHFLKSSLAVVRTYLPESFREFIYQRARWAAKARFYNDWVISFTALLVFAINFALLCFFCMGVFHFQWVPFVVLLFLKTIIDFPFLLSVSRFFNRPRLIFWFPLVQSFYFLYVSFTAAFSFVVPKLWKGRRMMH